MASLPVELLYGLYLGVLLGVVPWVVAWVLGFGFRYVTGVSIPGFGVVVLAVAIAGANGGLLALNDPTLAASVNQVRLTVALVVVLMGALYGHAVGDRLGGEMPRRLSLKRLAERTLAADVVERVGGRGRVRVTVAGEVGDTEGAPPLPPDLRARIGEATYEFPADLPLVELETRLADRLRTEFDLSEVAVALDERARATVSAAPPVGSLSRRLGRGERAVTVRTLVPAGLARGDEVAVALAAGDAVHEGTVLGVGDERGAEAGVDDRSDHATAAAADAVAPGEARVTLSVDRSAAAALVGRPVDRLVALSRGTRREFELVGLLRRAGVRFRRTVVGGAGPLAGTTLGAAAVRDSYGVAVLAVRGDAGERWTVAPRGDRVLSAGDALLVVGAPGALARFEEVVA